MTTKRSARRKRYPQEHLDAVQTYLMSMVPMPTIITQCAGRWGKPRTYVIDVVTRVQDDWSTLAAKTAEHRRHQIRNGFEQLYVKAGEARNGEGDLNLQMRILHELGMLDGCYKPQGVDVSISGAVGVGVNLGALGFKSQEEVRSRIAELSERLEREGPSLLLSPPKPISVEEYTEAAVVPSAAVGAFDDDH